ncbi:hypothetical protein [Methylogaea oryzae]|uniref:hypothetical protein n=1 Tax=Methylogaea oryzae TaxID=1295382 RepID=UPI0006D27E15|nr:hypothetical protein [Methylogaea oryzae]
MQSPCTLFAPGAEQNTQFRSAHALPDMAPDSLLVSLARGLHVFPPELLRQPIAAVRDCIARLPQLSLADGAIQLTPAAPLSRLLEDAADLGLGGDGILDHFERRRIARQYQVQLAVLAGDYDAAAAGLAGAVEDSGSGVDAEEVENGKRLLVWCLLEQADDLCRQAGGAATAESGRCYAARANCSARCWICNRAISTPMPAGALRCKLKAKRIASRRPVISAPPPKNTKPP